METQDPPNDTFGALKQVVLTPHDIPWSLRVLQFKPSNDGCFEAQLIVDCWLGPGGLGFDVGVHPSTPIPFIRGSKVSKRSTQTNN